MSLYDMEPCLSFGLGCRAYDRKLSHIRPHRRLFSTPSQSYNPVASLSNTLNGSPYFDPQDLTF